MPNEFKVKNGLIVDLGGANITGSVIATGGFTGSLLGTASNAVSSSFATTASFVTSTVLSSSYAATASFVLNAVSASFATSASQAVNAQTASFLPTGTYNITSSWAVSASQALTASYVLNAISSSFATSASYASQAGNTSTIDINVFGSPVDSYLLMSNVAGTTGVAIGGDADLRYNSSTNVLTVPNISATTLTGSLLGTASNAVNAISSSFASTSSFVQNAISASFASTASFLNTLNQNLTFNGNLTLNGTASISFLNVTIESASVIYSTGSNQFGDAANDTQTLFGSVIVPTGSLTVTGSTTSTGGFTGSLFGTSSWAVSASQAITASYVLNAVSSSFATSASFASTASFISAASTNAFVQNGNSFGTTAVLGTNDNQDLAFETSGSIRMFISSSGAVGIGTATPISTLDIRGTQVATSAIARTMLISSSLSASANNDVLVGLDINPSFNAGSFTGVQQENLVVRGGNAPIIRLKNAAGTTTLGQIAGTATQFSINAQANPLSFVAGNTEALNIFASTRNVLIQNGGTFTDRGYRLDVSGSGNFAANLTVTGSTTLHNGQTTIQGAGATSATTTLLVRNSNASSALTITDARSSSFGGNVDIAGDLSANNSASTRKFQAGYFYDIHPEASNAGVIPFYSNDIAYNTLRGGQFTASFGSGSTYTLNTSQIEAIFDGSPNYCVMDPTQLSGSMTASIVFPQTYYYGNIIGFSFGSTSWIARDFTVEILVTGSYVTLDTQTGYTAANYTKGFNYAGLAVTGARIRFSNFATPANTTGFRIAEIFLLNYSGQLGKAVFMGRDGGAVYKPITIQSGSTSAPAYSSLTDTNTGIYFPAADTLGFVEGGAEAMRINSSGQVGIGTTSPAFLLDVSGSGRFTNGLTVTGSLTATSFTGSLLGTSSWAVSASQAITASYVLNAVSASFATSASQAITASYVLQAVSASFTTLAQTANTASYVVTAQTASYVQNAQTASYVLQAVSASFATLAQTTNTASYVVTAQTASYVLQAVSASFASTASFLNVGTYAITSSWAASASQALTASYVLQAVSSSFASTASYSNTLGAALNNQSDGTLRLANSANTTISSVLLTASLANTASFINTLRQDAVLSGSLTISGSIIGSGSIYNTAISLLSATIAANNTASIAYGPRYLLDNAGVRSVFWHSRYLTDSSQSISVDWNSRTLVSGSTTVLDWSSGTGSLIGTSSWANRALTASFLPVGTYNITSSWATNALTASFLPIATYNITSSWAVSASQAISASRATTSSFAISASWAPVVATFPYVGAAVITGSLIVSGANGGIDTSVGQLLWNNGSGIQAKVDWTNGGLNTAAGINTVDWENQSLNDSSANQSVDWTNRYLIDSSGVNSVEWDGRLLRTPAGNYFNWTNDYYTTSNIYHTSVINTGIQNDFIDNANPPFAGQIIRGTVDATATAGKLVDLESDGIWYPVKNLAPKATRMLGICVDQATGQVLIEGDVGVSDDNTFGTYVVSASMGSPVYVGTANGDLEATQPTFGVVRVVGHIYYQSTTDTNYWLMKFRPSNDWYEQ